MTEQKTAGETHAFQAEVAKLLDIVINSLYSEKEIFLRELISNASDACDQLRYRSLTEPELLDGEGGLEVTIRPDPKARTISVADNGIGMNRDDLVANLGTIARSGSQRFLEALSGDEVKDLAVIGQFGVGFYAAFMVAERVEVITRKAGEDQGWRWESAGKGEFAVSEEADVARGTRVLLHLRKGEDEFLNPERLRDIITRYSDHIGLPIRLEDDRKTETVNAASALWTRPKNEISEDQYKEFYHHVAHGFDEPWLTLHMRAEGKIQYTGLLFVPGARPFDLFEPDRKTHVRLYVQRVFITEDCEGLLPPYLRFLRGVIDSDDLPLNISREMLQQNPVLRKIRTGLVKRLLSDLTKKAEKEPEGYGAFWTNFGAVLKEGIYEDPEQRDRLLGLARFRTTASADGWSSLADYAARMKEGQEALYYISGEDVAALRKSPQLEGFVSRGIEVLLLSDPVDEFWIPAVASHDGKPFKSVTRGAADLDAIAETTEGESEKAAQDAPDVASLIALFKLALGDTVKDVRASKRLTDSPVCLVADEDDLDMNLERLLHQHKRIEARAKRILEINPRHELIGALSRAIGNEGASDLLDDAAHLLYDQARILEGEALADPALFTRRLAQVMTRSFDS
jgi:molecular chaperone HtpG